MDLSGETILITGASSGLGRATAVRTAELGARVVLVSRSEERLEAVRQEMAGEGHVVAAFDLNNLDGMGDWLSGVAAEVGKLSGLVHSAGIHQLSPLQISTPSKVDELMRINFAAAMELTRGFRRRSVRADRSSVVYLSSIMGLVGNRAVPAYSASKGALIALARSLALELADLGVRVNCVCPGVVQTELATKSEEPLTDDQVGAIREMHPLGIGTPEDVANAIAFLLSDASRWITGHSLVVDGGYTAR